MLGDSVKPEVIKAHTGFEYLSKLTIFVHEHILLGVVFHLSPGGLIGLFLRKPLHTNTCVLFKSRCFSSLFKPFLDFQTEGCGFGPCVPLEFN